MIQSIRDL